MLPLEVCDKNLPKKYGRTSLSSIPPINPSIIYNQRREVQEKSENEIESESLGDKLCNSYKFVVNYGVFEPNFEWLPEEVAKLSWCGEKLYYLFTQNSFEFSFCSLSSRVKVILMKCFNRGSQIVLKSFKFQTSHLILLNFSESREWKEKLFFSANFRRWVFHHSPKFYFRPFVFLFTT